jgi:hypothetical protein
MASGIPKDTAGEGREPAGARERQARPERKPRAAEREAEPSPDNPAAVEDPPVPSTPCRPRVSTSAM